MKKTSKILVVLLSLALIFACFSVFAFADDNQSAGDTEGSGTVRDYEAEYEELLEEHSEILEYYESEVYLNARFASGVSFEEALASGTDEFSITEGVAFSALINDDGSATLSCSSSSSTKFNLNQTSPTSFGVNLRAKLSDGETLAIYANTSTGTSLRLCSVSVGKVTSSYDAITKTYVAAASGVARDEYFTLSFFLSKKMGEDVVTFTVTPDGKSAETYSYSYVNIATDMLTGKFKFDSACVAVESEATFDYIEMYEGSFPRVIESEENVLKVANAIADTYNDYNEYKGSVASGAVELAEIIAKLAINYNFTYSGDETLAALVSEASQNSVNAVFSSYAAKCKEYAEIIDPTLKDSTAELLTKTYNERLVVLLPAASYAEFVEGVRDGNFKSCYEAALASNPKLPTYLEVISKEKAALEEIRDNTTAAVKAALAIESIYLASFKEYMTLDEIFKNHPIDETFFDDEISAENIAQALFVKSFIDANFGDIKKSAEAFVDSVIVAANTTISFAERYAAYSIAKANEFRDTTYNEYLTNITVEELVAMYDAVDAEMSVVSAYAEAFLGKMRQVEQIPSYTAKQVALEEAAAYIESVEKGYPGVAAAIERYDFWGKEIVVKFDIAKKYIQAVNNIQYATTLGEKQSAIKIAEEFAAAGGNDVSVDVSIEIAGVKITVTDANVTLSDEKSKIALDEIRITNYTEAVEAIASKTDLLEKRLAIKKALALKATLNPEEDAVIKASQKLDVYISAYNAGVASANATAEKETETVLSVLSKTTPTKRIAEVVAIIKKFYED